MGFLDTTEGKLAVGLGVVVVVALVYTRVAEAQTSLTVASNESDPRLASEKRRDCQAYADNLATRASDDWWRLDKDGDYRKEYDRAYKECMGG